MRHVQPMTEKRERVTNDLLNTIEIINNTTQVINNKYAN